MSWSANKKWFRLELFLTRSPVWRNHRTSYKPSAAAGVSVSATIPFANSAESRKGRKEILTNIDGGWVQPYRPCAGDCTTQVEAFNSGDRWDTASEWVSSDAWWESSAARHWMNSFVPESSNRWK